MKGPQIFKPILVSALLLALVSCGGEEARMAKGFHLPEGDVERGKAAFEELKCTLCHSVAGVEFPGIESGFGYELGGEVRNIRTYGELVTAVIDPSHEIGPKYTVRSPARKGEKPKSPMPPYNSDMTVRQLGDIVLFLHSRYHEAGPDFTDYPFLY